MKTPRRQFRKGQDASAFEARDYAEIADFLERLDNLHVESPLQIHDDRYGRAITFPQRRGFWAKIHGDFSPYGFTELYRASDLTLVLSPSGYVGMPSDGLLLAYEVNLVPGLNGTVQWLVPGAYGDFRFQNISLYPGGGPPPTPCPATIHLQDCNGDPISGAAVTGTAVGGAFSGTTDGSGNYTLPSGGFNGSQGYNFLISYDGAFGGGLMGADTYWQCSNVYCFQYDKAVITVTSPSGTTATLNGGLPAPAPWVTTTPTAGTTVFAYKTILPCWIDVLEPPFPATCCVIASGGTYIPNCASLTINCNDNQTVSIPMYDWSMDYWGYSNSCDHDCSGALNTSANSCDDPDGEGPNFRGVFPKVLFATFHDGLLPALGFALYGSFGSLDGVTITMTWDPVNLRWDSGCLANPTNFASSSPYPIPCGLSSRVLISPDGSVGFATYSNADCTGFSAATCCFFGSGVDSPCDLTAPVDVTVGAYPAPSFTITQ